MTPTRRMDPMNWMASAALALPLAALFACGGPGGANQPAPAQQQPAGGDAAAAGGGAHPAILDNVNPNPGGGSAAMPEGHSAVPPDGGASLVQPPPPGAGSGASAITWTIPTGWAEEPPSSQMRRAQYHIPGGAGPDSDGECAVFYFGPGQGGSPMDNAQRWASQFVKDDGSPAMDTLKTTQRNMQGIQVLIVEASGTYTGSGMMPGMTAAPKKPGYALLGAIAEGPDSSWFFKFTGPAKTVNAQRDNFMSLLRSLKKGA
jgi:hypothetical protein